MCGWEVVLINFKLYSKLHQEKHVPRSRRSRSQLRTQHHIRQLLSRSQEFEIKLCLLYRGLEL